MLNQFFRFLNLILSLFLILGCTRKDSVINYMNQEEWTAISDTLSKVTFNNGRVESREDKVQLKIEQNLRVFSSQNSFQLSEVSFLEDGWFTFHTYANEEEIDSSGVNITLRRVEESGSDKHRISLEVSFGEGAEAFGESVLLEEHEIEENGKVSFVIDMRNDDGNISVFVWIQPLQEYTRESAVFDSSSLSESLEVTGDPETYVEWGVTFQKASIAGLYWDKKMRLQENI